MAIFGPKLNMAMEPHRLRSEMSIYTLVGVGGIIYVCIENYKFSHLLKFVRKQNS